MSDFGLATFIGVFSLQIVDLSYVCRECCGFSNSEEAKINKRFDKLNKRFDELNNLLHKPPESITTPLLTPPERITV